MYRGANQVLPTYQMNATGSITLWLISNKFGTEFKCGWNSRVSYYDC